MTLDDAVFDAGVTILGQDTSRLTPQQINNARLIFSLPVRLGGMGFTKTADINEAAYIGSWTLVGPSVSSVVAPVLAEDLPHLASALQTL